MKLFISVNINVYEINRITYGNVVYKIDNIFYKYIRNKIKANAN